MDSTWRNYLDLPGAKSLKHVYSLFTSHAWEKLVPDTANLVAVAGRGNFAENNYATTAIAQDGSFAISYLPSQANISINLARLKGKQVQASWFDPRTGERKIIGRYTPQKTVSFNSPTKDDWVLVIDQIQ
ncbi:putative collagen-binding domain-containing protein [Rhodocytophaga rosea]